MEFLLKLTPVNLRGTVGVEFELEIKYILWRVLRFGPCCNIYIARLTTKKEAGEGVRASNTQNKTDSLFLLFLSREKLGVVQRGAPVWWHKSTSLPLLPRLKIETSIEPLSQLTLNFLQRYFCYFIIYLDMWRREKKNMKNWGVGHLPTLLTPLPRVGLNPHRHNCRTCGRTGKCHTIYSAQWERERDRER